MINKNDLKAVIKLSNGKEVVKYVRPGSVLLEAGELVGEHIVEVVIDGIEVNLKNFSRLPVFVKKLQEIRVPDAIRLNIDCEYTQIRKKFKKLKYDFKEWHNPMSELGAYIIKRPNERLYFDRWGRLEAVKINRNTNRNPQNTFNRVSCMLQAID